MKKRRKLANLLTRLLLASLLLNFNACTNEDSPLSTNVVENSGLSILKIGSRANGLKKITSVSKLVSPSNGGMLMLEHSGTTADGTLIEVTVKLDVLPGAVNEDIQISMSLDDQALDLEFGPEGTVFNTPALLTVEAHNLDLSVNSGKIGTYYFNPETVSWELVSSEDVVVMLDDGYLKVVNAHLPHFSRYAVGWGE